MPNPEFQKLKRQVDKVLIELEDKALKRGINIASPEFQGFLDKAKEAVLRQHDITPQEFDNIQAELSMEDEAKKKVLPQKYTLKLKKSKFKGDKGDPGSPGHTPTTQELIALIRPLIPKPVPGPKGDKGDKGDTGSIDPSVAEELKKDLEFLQLSHLDQVDKIQSMDEAMAVLKILPGQFQSLQEDVAWSLSRLKRHTLPGAEWDTAVSDQRYYTKGQVDALIAGNTPTWGSITGTLSDQTDLQSALNAKQDSLSFGDLAGTANQVSLSASGTGVLVGGTNITLSLPQDIATASSPTFAGMTLSGLTEGSVLFAGSGGLLSEDNSNLFYDSTNHRLGLGITSSLLSKLHIKSNSLGVTLDVSKGIYLQNTSAATSSLQQQSPPILQEGQGWYNAGSTYWPIRNAHFLNVTGGLSGGSQPFGVMTWQVSRNGGAYVTYLTVTTGGTITNTPDTSQQGAYFSGDRNTAGRFSRLVNAGIIAQIDNASTIYFYVNNSLGYFGSDNSAMKTSYTTGPLSAGGIGSEMITQHISGNGSYTGSYEGVWTVKATNSATVASIRALVTADSSHTVTDVAWDFYNYKGSALTRAMQLYSNGKLGVGVFDSNIAAYGHFLGTTEQLRLGYDTSNYLALTVDSGGVATVAPTGAVMKLTGNFYPTTDDTYYLGKNSSSTPFAWKGVILKDTTDGNYYRIEVISGVVTATML